MINGLAGKRELNLYEPEKNKSYFVANLMKLLG
jgi:hypothetical protein